MSQELVRVSASATLAETMSVAEVFVASGLFKDVSDLNKAAVKIMAGREIGLGEFASMRGVNIIQGQCTLSGTVIAALVQGRGYRYVMNELSDERCTLAFYDPQGRSCGVPITFSFQDAMKAGLPGRNPNWNTYRQAMLFNRAISKGARSYCPAALNGIPVYTPEEMGALENADGDMISTPPDKVTVPVTPRAELKSPPPAFDWKGALRPIRDALKLARCTVGSLSDGLKAVGLDPVPAGRFEDCPEEWFRNTLGNLHIIQGATNDGGGMSDADPFADEAPLMGEIIEEGPQPPFPPTPPLVTEPVPAPPVNDTAVAQALSRRRDAFVFRSRELGYQKRVGSTSEMRAWLKSLLPELPKSVVTRDITEEQWGALMEALEGMDRSK